MPTPLPDLTFQFIVTTRRPQPTAATAQMLIYAETVEVLFRNENTGTFNRQEMKTWLKAPGPPLVAGSTMIRLGNNSLLMISIGDAVNSSELPHHTTTALLEII